MSLRRTPPRGGGAEAYRRAKLPRGRTAWSEAGFCAVDLEMTGLDPERDEIVSFAAIPIEHGRVRLDEAVSGRARPRGESSEAAIRIHGLRAVDLAREPPLERAIEPLLTAMAGRVPVVHVAAIERSFLAPVLRSRGVRLRKPMVDTSVLGTAWLFEAGPRAGDALEHGADFGRPPALTAVAESLGLPVHHPHDALGDALTTAQVFIALAAHLDARRPQTVRSLTHVRPAHPPSAAPDR